MIERLIRWSIVNRGLVLLATTFLTVWGAVETYSTPVDALPDLSDVQVIVRTRFPGQSPGIVEEQVTYPLANAMLSVPGARTVRGISVFGDSFVYVIFEDGTDLYWARARVIEYLNQLQGRLPANARAELGPDATGVGWVFQYALVDRTGGHDLAELRGLQDWFLRYELKSVPGVAEVATIGGMVRQYQVVPDPIKLAAYGVSLAETIEAIRNANQESGGAVLELAEKEYMVRAHGYLQTLDDFRAIPLRVGNDGVPVRLGDVAQVRLGPEMRRGITELDGEGEVVAGVVVLRSGENARTTIKAIKARLDSLRQSLPPGVDIVTTYDRSQLINNAIHNVTRKLLEEFVVVAIVCAAFLWHLRSSLVAIVALPIGVLVAFIAMRYEGVNANIMSLGGIAIALGASLDAAIVMVENGHKHIEAWQHANSSKTLDDATRWKIVAAAATEVGPALFFSLLVITISFLPVFSLEAQEGRLFGPLALTKTFVMAAAAGLSITLVPVLMGYWIRGHIPGEQRNPINRWLIRLYEPVLASVLTRPWPVLVVAALALGSTAWPWSRLGAEFMPPLDEGDLLYMPTALPGLSAAKARQLLQVTDRLIKTVPEVETVLGKAGRAESATDPAPLEMFETTVRLKPREKWRPGMTPERLIEELDKVVQVPGLANLWVPPVRNRIDMLATGIKSPIGVKVAGNNVSEIDVVARTIEEIAKSVPGVSSALAERLTGGLYVDIVIDRVAAARVGLNIADVQTMISGAVGGENIGEVIDQRARYPISVRYPREWRDTPDALRKLPILTPLGNQTTLGSIAAVEIADGPPMYRSENARPSGWVYVDVRGRDVASVARDLAAAIRDRVTLTPGTSASITGQFEYLERAAARLKLVIPATLGIIFVLLYLTFRRVDAALLVMSTLPFALIGGVWLMYLAGFELSVASAVGFIALAGVAAEFGVVMVLYLDRAVADAGASGGKLDNTGFDSAIKHGAVQRVRPKAMTVAVILGGLLPILFGSGTGSEIMSRIAAPMVGGMLTAPLMSMLLVPVVYRVIRRSEQIDSDEANRPRREGVDF